MNLIMIQLLTLLRIKPLALAIFLSHGALFAAEVCELSLSQKWEILRERGQLVNVNTLPGRLGICGAVCAINVLQVIAMQNELELPHSPQRQLENIVKSHFHGDGTGADMDRMISALDTLFQDHLTQNVKITGSLLTGVALETDKVQISRFTNQSLGDLSPDQQTQKILFTAQLDKNGNVLGFHAVVPEVVRGTLMIINEPSLPSRSVYAFAQAERPILNGVPLIKFNYVRGPGELNGTEIESFVVLGFISIEVGNPSNQNSI